MEKNLLNAPIGKLKVKRISGGENLFKKLSVMGIYEGSVIEKKISYGSGPVIVKVGNSDIAIGRGMSAKIIVEEER